jgi:peptidoglycan hydrolase-like protein with peptidoglycan-binding domain|tara:strand:- start:465 stop:785 length:321 start_codon:yes stop_codon:yes gene_type:complete
LSHANDVVALKHALYGAGYDINNVNAKLDENTRAELTRYQKDQGLEASGTLNEETKKALGMVAVAEAAPVSGAPAQAAAKPESEPKPEAIEQAEEKDDEDEAWSLW